MASKSLGNHNKISNQNLSFPDSVSRRIAVRTLDKTAWTTTTLRQAVLFVWPDWREP